MATTTYPAGVQVAPVALSVGGSDGKALGGRWEVRPSRPLMWAATRQPVLSRPLTLRPASVPEVLVTLPVTGQSGFIDPATGAPISAWSYAVSYQPLTDKLLTADLLVPAAGVSTGVAPKLNADFWPFAGEIITDPGSGGLPGTWVEGPPGLFRFAPVGVVYGRDPDGRPYILAPAAYFDPDGRPYVYTSPATTDPDGRPFIVV